MFSSLDHLIDLEGARVLDLFCGTGSLGLESISRGASTCTFVDASSAVIKQLVKVIDDFGIGENAEIVHSKLSREATLPTGPFDLVFVDAPYDLRVSSTIMDMVADQSVLSNGGLLVLEHGLSEFVMPSDGYEKVWSKEKGDTAVDILRWEPS